VGLAQRLLSKQLLPNLLEPLGLDRELASNSAGKHSKGEGEVGEIRRIEGRAMNIKKQGLSTIYISFIISH